MTLRKKLYSEEDIERAVRRITGELRTAFGDDFSNCALVGIHKQGVPLAQKILAELGGEKKSGLPLMGQLDISMYRDDIGNRVRLPLIRETKIPFDLNGRSIILVDDVLSSGRTIRAALDALTDYGRPGLIRLAVLVDRGCPEYPIRADFVGLELNYSARSKIEVRFAEDGEPGIYAVEWE